MAKSKGRERFAGIALSYINTFISMAITIFMVPALLEACGESEYSVYKVMSSFSAPLAVMNFGVSNYMSRAMAHCNQQKILTDNPKRQRIMGMSITISGVLWLLAILTSSVLFLFIDSIYANTFTPAELLLAKKLFVIMALNLSVTILGNGFQGCINGNEHFMASKSIILGKTLLKAVIIVVLILTRCSTVLVAFSDLFLSLLCFFTELVYIKGPLHEKFKFDSFEKEELKIFFLFAVSMLLQTVINLINNSIDNVLLGALVSDKSVITMYSSALTIYTAYLSVSYTISGIYHPSIVRAVSADEPREVLTQKAVVPAKLQAIVATSICLGFILFGDTFITVWIGARYINAYYVCIALMTPACFTSVSGIYEAFLDAKLKRIVRSLILTGMALYNIILSIILIRRIGFWGAAIGTSSSLIIGNLVIMNCYSSKISGVSTIKLYKGAFSGIWKSILLTAILSIPLKLFLPNTFMGLVVKLTVYLILYISLTLMIGIPKERRNEIFSKVKNIRRKL